MQLFIFVCSFLMMAFLDAEGPHSPALLVVVLALDLLTLLLAVAVNVRRIHDLGYSGWWLLGSYLAGMSLVFFSLLLYETEANKTMVVAVGIFGSLMIMGLIVWLGFFRGTVGPNPFGSDPTSPPANLPG